MNKVKVLVPGYARENENGSMNASGTSSLIKTEEGQNILVDPGANEKMLLEALEGEGLDVSDIDIVFLTHYHPDHILNIRLFPGNKIHDGDTIYTGDLEEFFEDEIPGTGIKVMATPGHAHEHASPIIETAEMGTVVIAEDCFWWKDGEQKIDSYEDLMDFEDPFAVDVDALRESRRKVLEIADWVIPGHGKMFKNEFKS